MSKHLLPLAGLKVLDFTQNLPGPYATFMLASLGAEVVKVESTRGDPARHVAELFDRLNRGKKSVALDLRQEESRPALEALISWADVLVEGFRPGVMARLGADEPRARALNPELIYCSISAFGQSGPRVDEPGHDLNLQALTGVCWLERDGDDVPRGTTLPIADLSASFAAVTSICAALVSRGDGDGMHLDVAMSDAVLSWASIWGNGIDMASQASRALRPARRVPFFNKLTRGFVAMLDRKKLYALPQYGVYPTADGRFVSIGIVDERHFWESFCDVLRLGPLKKLPMATRTFAGPLLRRLIEAKTKRFKSEELLRRCVEADVPATLVRKIDELEHEEQFRARDLFDQKGYTRAPLPGAEHIEIEAPELGEHTRAVLEQLGVTPPKVI